MELIKRLSFNDIVTVILVGVILWAIFDQPKQPNLDKVLMDKFKEINALERQRIATDSIRYEKALDSLEAINTTLKSKLKTVYQNLEHEKEYYQSIKSDSSFISINDSIEKFILSRH